MPEQTAPLTAEELAALLKTYPPTKIVKTITSYLADDPVARAMVIGILLKGENVNEILLSHYRDQVKAHRAIGGT